MREPVDHYMRGGLECIDAMRAISSPEEFRGYLRLTAFKYLWRLGEKDLPANEAKKCGDYVRWLQDELMLSEAQEELTQEAESLGLYGERAETVKAYSDAVKFTEEDKVAARKAEALAEDAKRTQPVVQVEDTPYLYCPHGKEIDAHCGTCLGGWAKA